MRWQISNRADTPTRLLADRHYNRQSIGAPGFVPPGRCLVLRTPDGKAFWVTSWPFAEYVKHAWAGAWMCSAFRNEAPDIYLSSHLIRQAVAATRWYYRCRPMLNGMVTFVDRDKTKPKSEPGSCYLHAGFRYCGETKGGLVALRMRGHEMPEPESPIGGQSSLFDIGPRA